jgi:hypothetical protein
MFVELCLLGIWTVEDDRLLVEIEMLNGDSPKSRRLIGSLHPTAEENVLRPAVWRQNIRRKDGLETLRLNGTCSNGMSPYGWAYDDQQKGMKRPALNRV